MRAEDRLEIGRILRPHGTRGEVVVEAVSNRPERFAPGSVLFAGERRLVVATSRFQGGADRVGRAGPGGRWILSFEGLTDRNQAEAMRQSVLAGEPLEHSGSGELWVHEVVGTDAVDRQGRPFGRVVAVEANPASDLLVLEGGGLVPMAFVVEAGTGQVVVDPPAGLLDEGSGVG